MKKKNGYCIIHFSNKKPIKTRKYDTAMAAYYEYYSRGCILVELFNENGTRAVSIKRESMGAPP